MTHKIGDFWDQMTIDDKIWTMTFMNKFMQKTHPNVTVATLPFEDVENLWGAVRWYFDLGCNSKDLEHWYPGVAKLYHRFNPRKELR